MTAVLAPTPVQALVRAARRASAFAGATNAARRLNEARAIVKLPDLTVSEYGAPRFAIARAIRANVVALAMVGDESARRAIAYSTRELCNALLSEPEPASPRAWWVDRD